MKSNLPTSASQDDLFAQTITQRFAVWKETPGGGQVLRIAYAITARYAARHRRTGRTVSMKLVWEILRDNVVAIRKRRVELKLKLENGFLLNNDFTAYVARHILEHRKEWAGLFHLREVGVVRRQKRTRVVVIEECGPRTNAERGVRSGGGAPEPRRELQMAE